MDLLALIDLEVTLCLFAHLELTVKLLSEFFHFRSNFSFYFYFISRLMQIVQLRVVLFGLKRIIEHCMRCLDEFEVDVVLILLRFFFDVVMNALKLHCQHSITVRVAQAAQHLTKRRLLVAVHLHLFKLRDLQVVQVLLTVKVLELYLLYMLAPLH